MTNQIAGFVVDVFLSERLHTTRGPVFLRSPVKLLGVVCIIQCVEFAVETQGILEPVLSLSRCCRFSCHATVKEKLKTSQINNLTLYITESNFAHNKW